MGKDFLRFDWSSYYLAEKEHVKESIETGWRRGRCCQEKVIMIIQEVAEVEVVLENPLQGISNHNE